MNYEMYDEWTDSIYECPMTYTPAGRLLTSGRSRFGYGNSHKPMCVYDTVSNSYSNLFWTADGQLRQQRRATAGPERINTYNAKGQLAMSLYDDGEQKTFGYYGYDGNGTRKYKITGKLFTTQTSQNPVVYTGIGMTPGEITVYPNPYIVLDNKGATKYYYAGTEHIASNVMCKPEYIISQTSDDEHIYENERYKYDNAHNKAGSLDGNFSEIKHHYVPAINSTYVNPKYSIDYTGDVPIKNEEYIINHSK